MANRFEAKIEISMTLPSGVQIQQLTSLATQNHWVLHSGALDRWQFVRYLNSYDAAYSELKKMIARVGDIVVSESIKQILHHEVRK